MTSSSDATERLDELEQQAREFADSLTSTVHSVVPEAEPFEATLAAHRAVVRQRPGQGIPLTRKHEPLLTLKWSSSCEWDLEKKFLAIRDSKVEVFATAGGHNRCSGMSTCALLTTCRQHTCRYMHTATP